MRLCLAINYGSRSEIADAVQAIAREVAAGRIDPESVNESTIEAHLYTAGMPDPDLVIRTAGVDASRAATICCGRSVTPNFG